MPRLFGRQELYVCPTVEIAMESNFEKSEKYQAARDSLREELREVYRQMVLDYVFHTTRRYGRGYVAYEVLADMIREGWRPGPSDSP